MAELLDSDLMLVNRSGTSYKVTGAVIKSSSTYIVPPEILTPTNSEGSIVLTSSAPIGNNIDNWDSAIWEVSVDDFATTMSATKAITDPSATQTLLPTERGAITLTSGITFKVRLKYSSTTPNQESEYSDVVTIETATPAGYAFSHYRKEDDDTYTAVPHCITMQEMEMVNVIRNFQDTLASFRARFGLPATQEIPQAIDGYFPLYTSEAESDLASDNGESHEHEINGVTYYMPDTGVTLYHGNYNS